MSCSTKGCHGKWCAWLQALSQVAVAGVIVYAGYVVNGHMESWTHSFQQGSDDLHSIRNDMNNISISMRSIDDDMEDIKERMEVMANIGADMNHNVTQMEEHIHILNQQMEHINYNVGGMRRKFSPQGMFRGMMPF